MEALELEIRRRPPAKRSLLHCIRSWSCSQLCQGLKLRGQVLIDGRGHHFKCWSPSLPQGPPMLILNPINSLKKQKKKKLSTKKTFKIFRFPSPVIVLAVSSKYAAILFTISSPSLYFSPMPCPPNIWQMYIYTACAILLSCHANMQYSTCNLAPPIDLGLL